MASDDEEYHSAPEDTSDKLDESHQAAQLEIKESRKSDHGDTTQTDCENATQELNKQESTDKNKSKNNEAGTNDNETSDTGDQREDGCEGRSGDDVEYVSGLDNRYVSEDHNNVKEKVELTEEQIKELKEQANKLKEAGNESFKSGEYEQAVEHYSEALTLYPPSCEHEIAVCYANRAACHMKMEDHQNVIDDCTKALELEPHYLKAILRKAQACEALEKYEDALENYKKALEIDPSQSSARQAVMYLPDKIKEQQEKMKEEMIGKLKELGNVVLKPFGLSTDNFQLQQDPQTGGYSVNFKR